MSGAKKAVRTGSATRGAMALAGAFLMPWGAGPAWACGPGAVRSALLLPAVAEKFALASDLCSHTQVAALPPEPRVPVAADGPSPVSAHAQQLWLYERPAEPSAAPVSEAATPVVPVRATTAATAPSRPAHRSTAEVLGAPKGVGREAVSRALALVPQISQVAEQYGIDPLLLHAIAHVESRHNPEAVSHAGAVGLMQVMPATARRFGVTAPQSQLRNPRISLEVCSAYLKNLQRRFGNDLTLVIAAYNAGEGAVEKYGRRVPPYKETQGYVRDVLAHYRLLLVARDTVRPATQAAL